jgi:hypothetical protein
VRRSEEGKMFKGAFGALLGAAIWSPGLLSVLTLGLYLMPADSLEKDAPIRGVAVALHSWPILYAILILAILLLLYMLVAHDRGTPSGANPAKFAEIETQLKRLEALKGPDMVGPAVAEVAVHLQSLRDLLQRGLSFGDTRWASATGYVEAYALVMRAGEAYIEATKDGMYAVRVGLHDWLRLNGSGIHDEEALTEKLLQALRALSPANALKLEQLTEKNKKGAHTHPNDAAGEGARAKIAEEISPDHAKADLREIDYAINEFRSDRWSGIIRARNKLAVTTVVFGFVVYAILCFAIAVLPNDRPGLANPFYVGLAFYLIGAVAGLFAQARHDAEADTATDDYGLSTVRVALTPLASGLAGLLGVLVLKLAADGNAKLNDIFDLSKNASELLIAGALGLSPQVLVGRLTQQADKYKEELKKSDAADGKQKADAPTPA